MGKALGSSTSYIANAAARFAKLHVHHMKIKTAACNCIFVYTLLPSPRSPSSRTLWKPLLVHALGPRLSPCHDNLKHDGQYGDLRRTSMHPTAVPICNCSGYGGNKCLPQPLQRCMSDSTGLPEKQMATQSLTWLHRPCRCVRVMLRGLTATIPRTTRVKLCFTAGRLPRKNPAPTNMIVHSRAPATLYAPNLHGRCYIAA